jgi:hypothetical protein
MLFDDKHRKNSTDRTENDENRVILYPGSCYNPETAIPVEDTAVQAAES